MEQQKTETNLIYNKGEAKTVFVTGGTGFIGGYIIQNLVQKGHHVIGLRRSGKLPFFIPQHILDKVTWVEGDILDIVSLLEAMQNVDAVIHSAAIVSFTDSERQQMHRVNIEGTKNVVNAAIEKKVKRFVHISSVAALGRTRKSERVSEDRKWEANKTNTHYATTKHQAELEIWRGFAEGLDGVIVNPSTVLGYGDWHQSSCAIFRSGYKSFSWYTEGVNGFVGVEDVAEAVTRLLDSDINAKRFIVNSDNWTFRKLFDHIAEGFGKRKPYRRATPILGEIVWRLEKMRNLFADGKPLLTRESARIAHSKTEFDNTAVLIALPGFAFTPLEEVIQKACEKYINALNRGEISL